MKKFLFLLTGCLLFFCLGKVLHSEPDQVNNQEVVSEHQEVHNCQALEFQLTELPAQAVAAAHQDVHDINVLNIDTIYNSTAEASPSQAPDCHPLTNHQSRLIPSIAIREASHYLEGSGDKPTAGNLRKLYRALQQPPLTC